MKAKKFFKGMTATAIAAVLAVSMVPMTAFVADAAGGSLTVTTNTGLKTGDKVTYYKVASLNTEGTYVWTWNNELFTDDDINFLNNNYDINTGGVTNANVRALAADLARRIVNNGKTDKGTQMVVGTKTDITADGYYLVTVASTTDASKIYRPMLVEIKDGENKDRRIDVLKATTIGINKKITGTSCSVIEGKTGTLDTDYDSDEAQVHVGDTIHFQIDTNIPRYDLQMPSKADVVPFTVTDTPTNMTIKQDTIKVYISDDRTIDDGDDILLSKDDGDYAISMEDKSAKIVLSNDIIFKDANNDGQADYAGKYLLVKLDATLDSTAEIETANPNEAKVTYGNDYLTGGNAQEKTDHADVFTTKLTIKKIDGGNNALPGARFQLKQGTKIIKVNNDGVVDENGNDTVVTNAAGEAVIKGLSAGKYTLTETAAPAGYRRDDEPKTIVIEATLGSKNAAADHIVFSVGNDSDANRDDEDKGFDIEIENIKGQSLPGTGGIGTTIFTIAGLGVIVVAGAMLIIYLKKKKADEE